MSIEKYLDLFLSKVVEQVGKFIELINTLNRDPDNKGVINEMLGSYIQ